MKTRHFALLLGVSRISIVSSFAVTGARGPATRRLNNGVSTAIPPKISWKRNAKHNVLRQDVCLQMSPITAIASAYSYGLKNYYLLTESLTFALFCIFGDLIAQTREIHTEPEEDDHRSSYDIKRSARFLVKGLGCGVLWSAWYKVAEGWSTQISTSAISSLPASYVASGAMFRIMKTASSLLLEQLIACPIVYALWDIPVLSFLKGKPIHMIPYEVRTKLGKLLIANAKMWTAANIFIYNVPLQWRVVALSGAEMIWQSILSGIASKRKTKTEERREVLLAAIAAQR